MKRNLFTHVLYSIILVGCQSHEYNSAAMKALEYTYNILVKYSACQSVNDCRRKEAVLLSSGGGVYIKIYVPTSPKFNEDLLKTSKELWNEPFMNCVPILSIRNYGKAKADVGFFDEPANTIELKREKCNANS